MWVAAMPTLKSHGSLEMHTLENGCRLTSGLIECGFGEQGFGPDVYTDNRQCKLI